MKNYLVLSGNRTVLFGFVPGFISDDPTLGAKMLGGLLAGVTSAGVLMALFQSNAGGAWDNAKKW